MKTLQLHSTFAREALFGTMSTSICLWICWVATCKQCLAVRSYVHSFIYSFRFSFTFGAFSSTKVNTKSGQKFWHQKKRSGKNTFRAQMCEHKFDTVMLYRVEHLLICHWLLHSTTRVERQFDEKWRSCSNKCVEVWLLKIYRGKVHSNAYSLWLKFLHTP